MKAQFPSCLYINHVMIFIIHTKRCPLYIYLCRQMPLPTTFSSSFHCCKTCDLITFGQQSSLSFFFDKHRSHLQTIKRHKHGEKRSRSYKGAYNKSEGALDSTFGQQSCVAIEQCDQILAINFIYFTFLSEINIPCSNACKSATNYYVAY